MAWYVIDKNGKDFAGPYNSKSDAMTFGRGNSSGNSVVFRKDESDSTSGGVKIYRGGSHGHVQDHTSNSTSGAWTVILIIVGVVLFFVLKSAWDNREHVRKTYYADGGIKTEQTYKYKKLNGVSKFYLSDGKIEKQQTYKDGKLDGVSVTYYENGNIKSKENYKQDKLNNVSKYYFENGNIEKEVTYKNNKKNGTSKIYYPNGQLHSEAMMQNNQLNGTSILYDEKGRVLRQEVFNNGKSTKIIE